MRSSGLAVNTPMESAEKAKARRVIGLIYLLMAVFIAGPVILYLLVR
jgi:hypothetical protein